MAVACQVAAVSAACNSQLLPWLVQHMVDQEMDGLMWQAAQLHSKCVLLYALMNNLCVLVGYHVADMLLFD
jgi:hypothetical protein